MPRLASNAASADKNPYFEWFYPPNLKSFKVNLKCVVKRGNWNFTPQIRKVSFVKLLSYQIFKESICKHGIHDGVRHEEVSIFSGIKRKLARNCQCSTSTISGEY